MPPADTMTPRVRSRWSPLWWVLLALLVLVVFCVAWVGIRGYMAKGELQKSVALATTLQTQISSDDAKPAEATAAQLAKHAKSARDLTSDPIWRAAEVLPLAGPNLTAVRQVSNVLSSVSERAVVPLAHVIGTINMDAFKPVNGAVNMAPLVAAQPPVAQASDALTRAVAQAKAIDTENTVHQVSDAVNRLVGVLAQADGQVTIANRAVQLLPTMLGNSQPRNYLLMFQNNAELRATGGIPGAVALLHAEGGRLSLVKQASSTDFPHYPKPVLPLSVDTQGLYGPIVGEYMQDVTLTPRFPVSAQLAREMWRRQYGGTVDGVVSVDPVALGYLLKATGPIPLPTGDTLSSDNAVKLLLSEAYTRYQPAQQDMFFASAAAAVFSRIAEGKFDPKVMIAALAKAGGERRVLLWSAHPDEQKRLAETTLAGMLPPQNGVRKTFGVYLSDGTASKMDYYLTLKVGLGQAICRKDGRPTWAVDMTLTNTAPTDAARALPAYVTGDGKTGVSQGDARTVVTVYAPKRAVIVDAKRDGATYPVLTDKDGDYPVAQYQVTLPPGASTTVHLRFIGAEAAGTLNAAITPLVNPAAKFALALSCENPVS